MSMNKWYEQNQEKGAKIKKAINVPVELLDFDPANNIRPLNEQHVNNLSEEYRKNGPDALPPLRVIFNNDEPYAIGVEGFHRYAAALKAGLAYLPCIEFSGTPLQKLALMVKSSQGLPLTALQRADAYKSMRETGASLQEIADEVLTSKTDVEDKLFLAGAPKSVRDMVEAGQVSATEAIKVLRKAGGDAEAILTEALKKAMEKGKKKTTNASGTFSAAKARKALELLSCAEYDGAALAPKKGGKKPEEFTIKFTDIEAAKELIEILEDYTTLNPDAGLPPDAEV